MHPSCDFKSSLQKYSSGAFPLKNINKHKEPKGTIPGPQTSRYIFIT